MTRVPVKPELFRWARERAGIAREDLAAKFGKLPEWESGETRPTLKQVEAFARAAHVPIGCLFLSKPPEESVPIPDFRTLAALRDTLLPKLISGEIRVNDAEKLTGEAT